jgi:hypothetical protein
METISLALSMLAVVIISVAWFVRYRLPYRAASIDRIGSSDRARARTADRERSPAASR